jgi:hypothetical protein
MNLDLSALRTFAAAVEFGGFGMAARQLHRTPGAVSLQLKAFGHVFYLQEGKVVRFDIQDAS